MSRKLHTVEDLLAETLGKWCECCQRTTQPYEAEDGTWPCCDGCWHAYSFWTPEALVKHADLVARYRRGD